MNMLSWTAAPRVGPHDRNGEVPTPSSCPTVPPLLEPLHNPPVERVKAEPLRFSGEPFDVSPAAAILTDPRAIVEDVNNGAVILLRSRRELLRGLPMGVLLAPPERAEFYRRVVRLNSRGLGLGEEWESRLLPCNGEPIEVGISVALVAENSGRLRGYCWLLRDLREDKQVQRVLQGERALAEHLVNSVQAYLLLLDSRGCILRSNVYLRDVCGYGDADLLGRHWVRLLLREHQPAGYALLEEARAGAVDRCLTSKLPTSTGDYRLVSWSARVLSPEDPETSAVLLIGQDVTEQQKTEQRLAQLEPMVGQGLGAAALAHEGRNALQRSQSCLERLKWRLEVPGEGPAVPSWAACAGTPEMLELLSRALQAHQDLGRFFEDLLLCAAPVRLHKGRCDLPRVWREAWDQAAAVHPGRAAVLRERVLAREPFCLGDAFRLAQVFRNLFENSFAACADPVGVEVCCTEASLDGRPALRLSVRDNGPGMTPEQRRLLFQPFHTTKKQGHGLGLVIAQKLIEAHGGRISVGETTQGTEFVLLLPGIEP